MSVQELEQKLDEVQRAALTAISQAGSSDRLEQIRLEFLGQKGTLTAVLRALSQLSKEERPQVGQKANLVKEAITAALDSRKEEVYRRELDQRLAEEAIDVTLPGAGVRQGHLHPLNNVIREIVGIFHGLGFSVAEGPEVETAYYNFDALNTPPDHPSRDVQDTFYTNIAPNVVLRSHTSPVQVRVMESIDPPLRFVFPGRVYRNEEINARKYPVFHQIEGLLVDRDVTFGQLKGVLNEFIRLLFGKPLKTRLRPDFFPFTEPSAELDCQCPFCSGAGCRTCGHRGWLELLGCGMVDPNVLSVCGIDPEIWSGFAFGMGVDRLAMLRYGINDIRHLFTADMRFIEQF